MSCVDKNLINNIVYIACQSDYAYSYCREMFDFQKLDILIENLINRLGLDRNSKTVIRKYYDSFYSCFPIFTFNIKNL